MTRVWHKQPLRGIRLECAGGVIFSLNGR